MKSLDIIKRSGRSLRQAKARTLLTAMALAVGGFTLTATLAAANGAHTYSNKLIEANFDQHSVIVAKDKGLFGGQTGSGPREYSEDLGSGYQGSTLPIKQLTKQDLAKLAMTKHVKTVVPQYTLAAQFITREGYKKYTGALNVYDPASKPQIAAGTVGDTLATDQVLLPDEYVPLLGFRSNQGALGKTVTVQVRQLLGSTQVQRFTIVGVTTKSKLNVSFEATGLYISLDTAKQLNQFINAGTSAADKTPSAVVRGDGIDAESLKAAIVSEGYTAKSAKDLGALIDQVINILQIIIIVFGIITLIASFFGVVNTQYISVLERTREIGLMKALGMRRSTVSWLFIIEATWIGFLGALIGSTLAIIAGTLLNPWISHIINFGNERLLIFQPLQIGALIVFLMAITTIAGLLPARKAARLDPIEALRTE